MRKTAVFLSPRDFQGKKDRRTIMSAKAIKIFAYSSQIFHWGWSFIDVFGVGLY